jgi:hypothetical protein
MPSDVLEAVACNGVDDAEPGRVNSPGLEFDLMVKVLQRDDPLRRSYLQRRWHAQPTSVPLPREMGRYNVERAPLSPVAVSRR